MSRIPDLPPMDGDALLHVLRDMGTPLAVHAADEIASLRARLAEVEGDRLMDAFHYGVLIGFRCSAEGYNGEHPGDTPTETILEHVEDYDADMVLEGIAAARKETSHER